ncbi:hypothetical protein F443_09639, partial [Phytophthora nicotianae P1569]
MAKVRSLTKQSKKDGKRRRVENAKRKADDAEAEVNEVVGVWTENDVFDGDSRLTRHEQRR